jgi:hypothetical protein
VEALALRFRLEDAVLEWFDHVPPVHVCWASPAELDRDGGKVWAAVEKREGVHFIAVRETLRFSAPSFVLDYLLAHEVLHVVLPPRGRCWHHRAFRIAERLLPNYHRANKWLERHGSKY